MDNITTFLNDFHGQISDLSIRLARIEENTHDNKSDIAEVKSKIDIISECVSTLKKDMAVNAVKIYFIVSIGAAIISGIVSIIIKKI